MLVLDYNEDRSLQITSTKERAADFSKVTMDFEDAVHSLRGVSSKVHIGSLSPYFHFGGGINTMTLIKNLRSSRAFLEIPLVQRNCEAELYEACRTRKLVEECSCVPWEMRGFQVGI